jgi:hypothetical protein
MEQKQKNSSHPQQSGGTLNQDIRNRSKEDSGHNNTDVNPGSKSRQQQQVSEKADENYSMTIQKTADENSRNDFKGKDPRRNESKYATIQWQDSDEPDEENVEGIEDYRDEEEGENTAKPAGEFTNEERAFNRNSSARKSNSLANPFKNKPGKEKEANDF